MPVCGAPGRPPRVCLHIHPPVVYALSLPQLATHVHACACSPLPKQCVTHPAPMWIRIGINRNVGESDRPQRNRSLHAHASLQEDTAGTPRKAQSCQRISCAAQHCEPHVQGRRHIQKPSGWRVPGSEAAFRKTVGTARSKARHQQQVLLCCATRTSRCSKHHSPTSRQQLPRQAAVRESSPHAQKHKPSVHCLNL